MSVMFRTYAAQHFLQLTGLPIFILVTSACASNTNPQAAETEIQEERYEANLYLDIPENGFQVETLGNMIEAGDDIKWCEVVQLPGTSEDIYYVKRIESIMPPSGQSLEVSAAITGTETDENMEVGMREPCQRAGEVFGEELEDVMFSQQPYHNVRYPKGIGKILYGGQKIVIDHHYFNSSDKAIPAKVKLNFYLGNAADVKQISRTATFENFTIYTPPSGESSHLAECFFDQDILVSSLERWTHRWGTDFTVWFAGGERDGEHIWTSSEWDKNAYYTIPDGPILLKAGEGFRFQCNYHNNTNNSLQFGVYAIDEICILRVNWWVENEESEANDKRCLLFTTDEDGISRK